MKPSQLFFDLVKHYEGLRLISYQDSICKWTIGYGTTVYPNGIAVKQGDTCTEQQAEEYLLHHVENNININSLNLNQYQYDAILSFCYNLGQGNFDKSTLKKDIIIGAEDETIEADFLMWNKAGGKILEGLTKRRKSEAYLFNNGKNNLL